MKRNTPFAVAGTFALALSLVVLTATPAHAGLMSKVFKFKPDVTLEVGADGPDGLRLDSVRFRIPPTDAEGKALRTGGLVAAEVSVSNVGEEGRRVGVAIALLDDEGRLLAVASGGNRLTAIRPQRQRTFRLVFDDVNDYVAQATTFHISIEGQ